ncbi:MAG TPA: winged helix-turn-helix domain-containing protein, partial [Thermoleophilaceae bacterium]|nr:winged helix-turn-helix domain-containing protein [Thermoleophilaceae bacterium]
PLTLEFGTLTSAVTLLIEAFGGVPFGSPPQWRRAAISGLDARDAATLAPIVKSPPEQIPSCLCILTHRAAAGSPSLEEDLERMMAIPPEVLASQLPPGDLWAPVVDDPQRWLERFVCALRRACEGLQDLWSGAGGLLDRETERVGVAALHGAARELIVSLLPPVLLKLDAPELQSEGYARRLRLVPSLAGPGSTHAWVLGGELTHIVYPLANAWHLLEHRDESPAALEALLGHQRALILRHLDRPTSPGRLAEALIAVPSAASHHLTVLERAGLVERERQGRNVLVRRTERGTGILSLYERS